MKYKYKVGDILIRTDDPTSKYHNQLFKVKTEYQVATEPAYIVTSLDGNREYTWCEKRFGLHKPKERKQYHPTWF